MKKIILDKNELIEHFVKQNKTLIECSSYFGCSVKTLRTSLKQFKIKKDAFFIYRPMVGQKYGRWLILGINEISKKFICKCECKVEKEISFANIKKGKSKSCGCYHKEIMALCLHSKSNITKSLSKEQLNEEYIQLHKTDKQIGNKYGFHEETIRRYRKSFGINRYVISTVNELSLTEEQKEIIDGTIMGDGHFTSSGQLDVAHCLKQYSYIYWMNSKLNSISTGLKRTSQNKYRFKTKALNYIKDLYKLLYDNKVKRVNLDFLNRLTPLGLSIWFSDDGYLDNDSNYVLCTHGFSDNDKNLICQYFEEKWGIITKIKKMHSKRYAKTYYANSFDHENATKLSQLIKYHMVPSMLYKLLKSERKHIIYLAGGMQASPDGGIKWRRNIKSMLNKLGYYCIDPTKEENCLLLDDDWRSTINTEFSKFQKNMKVIIDNDLYFVNMADSVVCLYDDFIGGGSFHEIGECYLKGKKLYILNLHKKSLSKLSWWALGCCTKVVESYEELLSCFENISDKPYVPYHKNKILLP